MLRFGAYMLALVVCGCCARAALAGVDAGNRKLSFERDVRPILKAHCFQCHGEGEKNKSGLDLRLRRLIVEGGDSGPAIVPHKSGDSELFKLISRGKMPRGKKKLTPAQIELIRRWIDQGAVTLRPEPEKLGEGFHITREDRDYWAFQPVSQPAVPPVHDQSRARTAIDRYVLNRLEANGLTFSPDADRVTLIRRATFDLTGLPPTPQQVDAFVADQSKDAYEKVIDRLLASPRYGERWARHWLDTSGYADSEGYTDADPQRPHAWRYRDYVIKAFNDDKPFDQFIVEQLAGDELIAPPYRNLKPQDIEKLTATGFLRMSPDGTGASPPDQNVARNQVIADTIQIVSTSLLGLTVGCAQCHDHRYDPISQEDYYQFRAIFEPAYDWKNWRAPAQRLISLYTDADRAEAKRIEQEAIKIEKQREARQKQYIERTFEKQLSKLDEKLRDPIRAARITPADKRTKEQKKLLADYPSVNVTAGSLYLYDKAAADDLKRMAKEAAKVRDKKPKEQFIRALTEAPGKVPATHLFARGDFQQPKQTVKPAELAIVAPTSAACDLPENDASLPTTGRRLAYARWLTSGSHPLTARVIVNRVWARHFGRGLVATPGDFGRLGQRPTHPKLLDWLAHDFVAHGWKLKRLHRLIVTSTVYRQASRQTSDGQRVDADNRLLWRMPVRRLEAEAVRDAMLQISGKLNVEMYGPPVPVMEDAVGQIVIGKENKDGEGKPGKPIPLNGQEFRRSIYVQVRRSRPLSVLDTFDLPAMTPNCTQRASSTVAPQALLLMNSPYVESQGDQFAQRVRAEAGDDLTAQIARAWRLVYGDAPSAQQLDAAQQFVREQARLYTPASSKKQPQKPAEMLQRALSDYCHALLSSNRFLYVD